MEAVKQKKFVSGCYATEAQAVSIPNHYKSSFC